MDNIQIDWLVVFIAAIINMVIGYFWYSKWLFAKAYSKLSKHADKDAKPCAKTMVLGFIASLVIAYFLSFFEAFLGVTTVTDGMFVGFLLWLGFVATTQVSSVIWNKRPFKLFMINSGFKLVSYLVMSGIIGA